MGIIPKLGRKVTLPARSAALEKIALQTRKESYDHILEGLGERQKLVYKQLKTYTHGATAKELSVSMFNEGLVASPERNSVHPRLNEMVEMGIVKIVGKKTCQYTNRSVAIYKN